MQNINLWNKPGENIQLTEDSVHICLVNVDDEKHKQEYLSTIISNDELDRANRFVFEKDTERHIIARGILRLIISQYIHMEPKIIKFSIEKRGKLILNHPEYKHLKFNLSHSGQYIIYAITYKREVGIDIEYIKDFIDSDQIVNRFFSKKEIEEYFALPSEIRKRAFFTCWTRKEAFIKAIGEGLYMPLDQFSVSPNPNKKSNIEIHKSSIVKCNWLLEDIDVNDSNYVSAVVVDQWVSKFIYSKWSFIDK